jgi:hypothetical protein
VSTFTDDLHGICVAMVSQKARRSGEDDRTTAPSRPKS